MRLLCHVEHSCCFKSHKKIRNSTFSRIPKSFFSIWKKYFLLSNFKYFKSSNKWKNIAFVNVNSGRNFSQTANELGPSSILARNELINAYTLYLIASLEWAWSQTDKKNLASENAIGAIINQRHTYRHVSGLNVAREIALWDPCFSDVERMTELQDQKS